MAKTVGEVFDERGPCTLAAKALELYEALGLPMPAGHRTIDVAPGWTLEINGTKEKIGALLPYYFALSRTNVFPPWLLYFNVVGMGGCLGGPSDVEDRGIEVLELALARAKQKQGE